MDETMKQAILKMGIFELRTFAREMGVSSPTTLKRQQLIEEITKIANGEKQGYKGLTRGRKPKQVESVTNMLQKYIDNSNSTDIIQPRNLDTHLQVASASKVLINNTTSFNGVRYVMEGEVEVLSDGTGQVKNDNNLVIIPQNLIELYGIETGETIKMYCVNSETPNCYVATDINEDLILKNNPEFNRLDSISKSAKLNIQPALPAFKKFFEDYSLHAGQCVLFTYTEDINPEIIVNEIVKSTQNINTKKIAVFSDQLENASIKEDFNHFYTMSVLDKTIKRVRNIDNALTAAKKYALNGEDCILIIGNLSAVFGAYTQVFASQGNSEYISNEYALQYIYALLGSAKQTVKGSITIFAIAQAEDDCVKKSMPLCNARVNFKKSDDSNQIIVTKSFSIYDE